MRRSLLRFICAVCGGAPDKLWIPQGASTNTEYMPVVDENGIWIVDEYWS